MKNKTKPELPEKFDFPRNLACDDTGLEAALVKINEIISFLASREDTQPEVQEKWQDYDHGHITDCYCDLCAKMRKLRTPQPEAQGDWFSAVCPKCFSLTVTQKPKTTEYCEKCGTKLKLIILTKQQGDWEEDRHTCTAQIHKILEKSYKGHVSHYLEASYPLNQLLDQVRTKEREEVLEKVDTVDLILAMAQSSTASNGVTSDASTMISKAREVLSQIRNKEGGK